MFEVNIVISTNLKPKVYVRLAIASLWNIHDLNIRQFLLDRSLFRGTVYYHRCFRLSISLLFIFFFFLFFFGLLYHLYLFGLFLSASSIRLLKECGMAYVRSLN